MQNGPELTEICQKQYLGLPQVTPPFVTSKWGSLWLRATGMTRDWHLWTPVAFFPFWKSHSHTYWPREGSNLKLGYLAQFLSNLRDLGGVLKLSARATSWHKQNPWVHPCFSLVQNVEGSLIGKCGLKWFVGSSWHWHFILYRCKHHSHAHHRRSQHRPNKVDCKWPDDVGPVELVEEWRGRWLCSSTWVHTCEQV